MKLYDLSRKLSSYITLQVKDKLGQIIYHGKPLGIYDKLSSYYIESDVVLIGITNTPNRDTIIAYLGRM